MAADRLRNGDLLAGAAAATLFVLATVLDVHLWLSVSLALGTYAIASLLRSKFVRGGFSDRRRHESAYVTAVSNTAAIRALLPSVSDPAVRDQIGRILVRCDRILKAIDEDKNLAAAPLFNERLLEPFIAFLTNYVRLAKRNVKSAGDLLAKAESHDLPMFERAADDFFERLHRALVVDLATLADILELNLESMDTSTMRRSLS
jgi:hypothetical protein